MDQRVGLFSRIHGSDPTVDPTALCQRGNQEAIEYLLDNYWLMRYVGFFSPCHAAHREWNDGCGRSASAFRAEQLARRRDPLSRVSGVHGSGDWRERSGWNETQGLPCPHSCGAKLHRGCAYRTLMTMESTDDDVGKGRCPNCKELWSLDVGQLTDDGRVYRRSSRKSCFVCWREVLVLVILVLFRCLVHWCCVIGA